MSHQLSVVMPVWNGERYLAEAVESILSQTLQTFEFLILDDGSTDSTPDILRAFANRDSRIRLIQLNHEGIVVALNCGIAEAKSNWIARMDCDDIAHPDRLKKQIRAITSHPGSVLCHTGIRQIGEPALMAIQPRFSRTKAFLAARLCFQCPIIHPSVIFSKSAFLQAGGFRESERHAEDYALWGRLLSLGDFVGLPEPLLNFRVHGGSISKKKADVQGRLTSEIARRHCRQFMGLTDSDAVRAHDAIRSSRLGNGFGEWLWFLSNCLPRLRWQSAEMWAWAASQTMRRFRAARHEASPGAGCCHRED